MYYPFEKRLVDNKTIKFVRGFTSTHDGEDWSMPVGTPLYSPDEGTITQVGKDQYGGYWLYVVFKSGYRFLFVHISRDVLGTDYYHMAKGSSKTVSRAVKAFELVCYSGNTGKSTGPHLHHELRDKGNKSIDPKPHLSYYNSNSMAQWCIDRAIRDASASNMDAFLNKYRKDVKDAGVDPVEWWVRNGSAEIPVMYEKMIADRDKYKALSEELGKQIEHDTLEQNRLKTELEGVKEELKKTKHDLGVANNELDNVGEKFVQKEKEIAHWKSLAGTNEKLYNDTNILLNRCREGRKGITFAELLARMLNALRNLLNKRPKKS